ncbi:unnamed protein product [Penicillium camemberti]|uniref:Str. FM013 n=1 Tax=Penicillium camemberti (strain FM 013) TaxID=1429867 RepID=A0A0G4PCV0_PENC3|nr:unnamed protein product [Penicillium camemberti]
MNFDISAQFMLTEVNHGLDARNIQMTATILSSGDIDLHILSSNDANRQSHATNYTERWHPRTGAHLVSAKSKQPVIEWPSKLPKKPTSIRNYLIGVIQEDSVWYVEQGGLSREIQREMESQVADVLLPNLENIAFQDWKFISMLL